MPTIYLSPSTQEYNTYITGGSEEYHMNQLADAMEPYLRQAGINFTRNTPGMTAASSIRASNAGNYDFHLALHSNASPEATAGQVRGFQVYYYPGSADGERMADLFVKNFKKIYPDPGKVEKVATTSLGEVSKTRALANLVEFAYHDNPEDAEWIINNTDLIARTTVQTLAEYFGLPFEGSGNTKPSPAPDPSDPVPPMGQIPPMTGTVQLTSGNLNIRNRPSMQAAVVDSAPDNARLTVLGRWDDWYVVNYHGTIGYASANYILI